MNTGNPFLDKRETVGMISEPKPDQVSLLQRVQWNRKRGRKITTYARQNDKTYKALNKYLMETDFSTQTDNLRYFINLRNKLQQCCKNTLVRQFNVNDSVEFIAAHTCKHKICKVCNHIRAKDLRRKYLKFFEKDEIVDMKTGEVFTRSDFDFMHLTLTVPHSSGTGFRGKEFYADELIREFNFMRKKTWWRAMVFAGEFGIEVTENKNGMHVHIHSLLLVKKGLSSRNALHRKILLAWNTQTVDKNATRKTFTDADLQAIAKGNKLLSEKDLKRLNPKGGTLIGLESLYVYQDGKKRYVKASDQNDLIAGILECIKYHFEPVALDKATDGMNWNLLHKILPQIHGKPLYRKFGAFHGLTALNINDTGDDDIEQTLEEIGHEEIIHPDTLKVVEREDFEYIIVSGKSIHYPDEENTGPRISRSAKRTKLRDCDTLRDAMFRMMQTAIAGRARARNLDNIAMENSFPDEDSFYLIDAA